VGTGKILHGRGSLFDPQPKRPDATLYACVQPCSRSRDTFVMGKVLSRFWW